MKASRFRTVERFYAVLDQVAAAIGGTPTLADCTGKMTWPDHGVYFFFENKEARTDSGRGCRVVRVGSHALTASSRTRLWNRLSQHRGVTKSGGGNHRGSIFRLLVGEALLAKDPGLIVPNWGKGQSAAREVRQLEVEHEIRVSQHIRSMPFLWLGVGAYRGGAPMRAVIERNAIALLSNYEKAPPIDSPSRNWLGNWSPREKVRSSGLWNQNHVDEPWGNDFLNHMSSCVGDL